MTPFKQLIRHNPPESTGDCYRTSIACLVDRDPSTVPHFVVDWPEDTQAQLARYHEVRAWLRENLGLDMMMFQPPLNEWLPRGLCIASGESPRFPGLLHSVVWQLDGNGPGRLVHDPHPDGTGIVGDPQMYEFLIAIDVAELRKAA